MKKRVVVTGLGAVTPLGNTVPVLWENLLAGKSGIGPITHFDPAELDVKIAAEVKDFDLTALFDRKVVRRNDRFTLLAMEAARQAVEDAGLQFADEDGSRVGVLVGTAIGGMLTLLANYDIFLESGPRRISPLMGPMLMPNGASAAIAIIYDLYGPAFSVASACATGNQAIGEAAAMIQRGQTDIMICGGSDAIVHPLTVAGFRNMGALSTRNGEPQRASRPFDAARDGFVLGEGAGVLVLESLEYAQQRGGRIYAELIGYGATCDAFHITAPDEEGGGAARAMEAALADAGLAPDAVDYINAHGTSTLLNDVTETRAIRTVFGDHADQLAVSSTKSMVGHTMGAAGAIEAIACVKSLETGWVHPTTNYENPDPQCDLDYVPGEARRLEPRVTLSNSFGFGGHNACLILSGWGEGA